MTTALNAMHKPKPTKPSGDHIERMHCTKEFWATVNGKPYHVVQKFWSANNSRGPGERWEVYSYIGANYGKKECDPDKPTYQRVLAAVRNCIE